MRRSAWLAHAVCALLVACGESRTTPDAVGGATDATSVDGAQHDGAAACASPGSPDASFGQGGVTPIIALQPGESASAVGVAIDSTSRIVIAGGFLTGSRSCVLARLLPDGSRDASFGANGIVRQSVNDRVCWYNDLAIQADGKIVAFGEIDGHTNPRAVIGRYTSNGTLDSTFGDQGIVVFDPAPITSGLAMTIDAQQRIVVVGDASIGTTPAQFYTRRYLPDGNLDSSFGMGGVAEEAFGLGFGIGVASDVSVQQDGKIVVVGGVHLSQPSMAAAGIVRYNNDGTKDTSFGSMGRITIDGFSGAGGLLFEPLGRSVVVGSSEQGGALTRLMSDGSIDPTFGAGGVVVDADQPSLTYGSVAFSDDKLLVFGQSVAGMSSVALARYSAGGIRDSTFGANGFAHDLPLPPGYQVGWDLAVQSDGRIVIVGGYSDLDTFYMLVARYCP